MAPICTLHTTERCQNGAIMDHLEPAAKFHFIVCPVRVVATSYLLVVSRSTPLSWEVQAELLATEPLQRSRSLHKAHLKRMASACLEILVKKGEPPTVASSRVARAVSNWPNIGEQEITSITIENWREAERRREAGPERDHFNQICNHILGLKDPMGEIERLLKEGPPDAPTS
jgi:hypothetical protein